MPSINDSRKVIETSIPSIPDSKIELWDSLTMGDTEKISAENDEIKRGMLSVFCLIKSWNFEEPLTLENVKKLKESDFVYLLKQTSYGANLSKALEELEDESTKKKLT